MKSINEESSEEINFYLIISTGGEYKVKGKSNDIFQTVLDNCLKVNNLFDQKKKVRAIFDGRCLDNKKSLRENEIVNDSYIIIYLLDLYETPNPDNNIEQDSILHSNKEKENDIDDFDMNSFFNDLVDLQINQNLIYESILLNNNDPSKKKEKEKNPKQCEHKLILLFSNSSWSCNNCNKSNSEKEPKYFCSLCNYNICNNCIGDNNKFLPLEPFCHEQTKLKSYKFPFHEHNLIYCRTSRSKEKPTIWNCDICNKLYDNKIWSFYCTYCDYDLCLKCSKKYFPSDELVTNMGIKTDNHNHPLVFMITNRNWSCKLCKESFESIEPTYYCTECEYNICMVCMRRISDEEKYPFFNDGERKDYEIKTERINNHQHQLIYCITSRYRIPTTWTCNICSNNFGIEDWSFYCSLCDYDICFSCYLKSIS